MVNKTTVTRIPRDLLYRLKIQAAIENRNIIDILTELAEGYLSEVKKENGSH